MRKKTSKGPPIASSQLVKNSLSQVRVGNVTEGWPTEDGVTLRYHLFCLLCAHAELVTWP